MISLQRSPWVRIWPTARLISSRFSAESGLRHPKQIVDPAGLLNHDRHRVVDLVGDARGELADRGQPAGLDDLVGHDGSFAVGFGKPEGEAPRDKEADGEGHDGDDQEGDDGQSDHPSDLLQGIGRLLLVAEQPPTLFERREGEDRELDRGGSRRRRRKSGPNASRHPGCPT